MSETSPPESPRDSPETTPPLNGGSPIAGDSGSEEDVDYLRTFRWTWDKEESFLDQITTYWAEYV